MTETVHVHHTQRSHPPAVRPSILRSKSNSDISTTSSDSKASSITFAPLPSVEARKRRSDHPIGLASRAEMLRRTRRQYDNLPSPPRTAFDNDDGEIHLPDFGKMVKGLWRSVSRGHGGTEKDREASQPEHQTTFTEGINTSAADDVDGEGGVWMEQVTWAGSDSDSPPRSRSSSAGSKRDTRRDTLCMVDGGSFLNELDGVKEIQARHPAMKGEVTEPEGTRNDIGSREPIPVI